MADEEDNGLQAVETGNKKDDRRFWQKKSNYALMALGLSAILSAVPGAPVLFAIGVVPVTTEVIAKLLLYGGAIFGDYSGLDRIKRFVGK